MNKAQRHFKKEMAKIEKENPRYFEHHNTYIPNKSSMRKKVMVGGGILGGGILGFRLILFLIFYGIPFISTFGVFTPDSDYGFPEEATYAKEELHQSNTYNQSPSQASGSTSRKGLVVESIKALMSINNRLKEIENTHELAGLLTDLDAIDIHNTESLHYYIRYRIEKTIAFYEETDFQKRNDLADELNAHTDQIRDVITKICNDQAIMLTIENDVTGEYHQWYRFQY